MRLSGGTHGSRGMAGTQHMAQTRPTCSAFSKAPAQPGCFLAPVPSGALCHPKVMVPSAISSNPKAMHRGHMGQDGPLPSDPRPPGSFSISAPWKRVQGVRAHRFEFIFILISSERCRKKRIAGELCACSHHAGWVRTRW